jgi:hypothetical protein
LFVTQEKNYVSVYIRPVMDLTLTLTPSEKGVIALVGFLKYGNPYYPTILGNLPSKILSTNSNIGGTIENETMYHISDYFAKYKGKMIVGRIMKTDSSVTVAKVEKNDDGVLVLDDGDAVNVFGADNIKDWSDKASDGAVEVLITSCISEKFSINVVNEDDILTVSIYDYLGNIKYEKSGSCFYDALDDNGNSYYIGNLVNEKIISVKADTSNDDYESDFNLVRTYEDGIVATSSDENNYAQAIKIVDNNIEKCDYTITAGIRDTQTIKDLYGVAFRGKTPMAIDVYATDVKSATDYKNNIGIITPIVTYIWNRGKDIFKQGNQSIGISGAFVGDCVTRNLSSMVDDVEYRVEGCAGEDYPLPRNKADELEILTDDELTSLSKNRINTVRYINDVLCISDVLSANPKNQATKLFPVSEGNLFIDRYIAKILTTKIFKNLNDAKSFVSNKVNKLFEKAKKAGYFDNDIDTPYDILVTKKDTETISVKYQYVASGVMRKGDIQGMIVSGEIETKLK